MRLYADGWSHVFMEISHSKSATSSFVVRTCHDDFGSVRFRHCLWKCLLCKSPVGKVYCYQIRYKRELRIGCRCFCCVVYSCNFVPNVEIEDLIVSSQRGCLATTVRTGQGTWQMFKVMAGRCYWKEAIFLNIELCCRVAMAS